MPQSLGDALRAAREKAGLSQDEAARLLRMRQPQLSKYERGINAPGAQALARLAQAYRTNIAALLGDSTSGMEARTEASDEEPDPFGGPDVPTIQISRDAAMYWRGRLVEQVHTLRGVGESMHALLRMLEKATDGVDGLSKSGVLTPSMDVQRMRELRDALPPPTPNGGASGADAAASVAGSPAPAASQPPRRGRRAS